MKAVGRQRVGMLIELVQNSPVLYDRQHAHFMDKAMRDRTWQGIADVLNIDCQTIMRAWKSMRNHYTQTIRSTPCNKWRDYRYAGKMAFLREHLKPRDGTVDDITSVSDNQVVPGGTNNFTDYNYDEEHYLENENVEPLEDCKNFLYDKEEILEDRRHDAEDNTISEFSKSPPMLKRPSSAVMSLQPSKKCKTTQRDGFSGAKETFNENLREAFVRWPFHSCAKQQSFDELDRFFLSMSSSVKDLNITGIGLLRLKSRMLYHLLEEVTQLKNNENCEVF